MLLGDLGAADPRSLQAAGVDQAARGVARRIREDRAAVVELQRLRRLAKLEEALDLGAQLLDRAACRDETRREHELVVGNARMPVVKVHRRAIAHLELSVVVQQLAIEERVADLAELRAGVHQHGATDAPRNPGARLQAAQPVVEAVAQELAELDRPAGADDHLRAALALLDLGELAAEVHDTAGKTAIREEHVRPGAEVQQRNSLLDTVPHQRHQVVAPVDPREPARGSADRQRRVTGERFVFAHEGAKLVRQQRHANNSRHPSTIASTACGFPSPRARSLISPSRAPGQSSPASSVARRRSSN